MMMSEELEAILRAQYDGGYNTTREAEQLQCAIGRLPADPLASQRLREIIDAADDEIYARTAHRKRRPTAVLTILKTLVPRPRIKRTTRSSRDRSPNVWPVPGKYRRVRFSAISATACAAIAGAVAVTLAKPAHDLVYWLSATSFLVPVVVAVADVILRPANSRTVDHLDECIRKLRESVLQQWTNEVEHRISVYLLPVPFSAAAEITEPVTLAGGKAEDRVATVAVMDSWAAILREPGPNPPRMDGTFHSIADVFGADGMPSRLVVLGEPGSGKSILAQSLTLALLRGVPGARSGGGVKADPAKAVPVLLPLATWDPRVALQDWAAAQMARTYPWLGKEIQARGAASRTLAGRLLDQGRVLIVLDGLDEVSAENRQTAFRKLSEAAHKNQPMVVTCRTREYAQIVHDARHPMPRTPVIRLHPMPLGDVRDYLTAAGQGSGGRVAQLVNQLDAAPHGPLAQALRLPLALWLVATVYQDPDKDPAELAQYPGREEILKHLLDGLVTAAYSVPAGGYPAIEDPEAVATARRRLTKIADYLGPGLRSQNIDWWRLPEKVPRLFTGGLIGTLVGCVLGAAVGLAAAVRFSSSMGTLLGIVFGIVTGALGGVTSARPQAHPFTVQFRFRWDYWRFMGCLTVAAAVGLTTGYAIHLGGGLVAGLITAAAVGPACAVPCIRAFGRAPGITAGLTASTALGLASGLSAGNGHPVWSGLVAGLVFLISAWVLVGLFQPAQDKSVVSPQSLLDRDRIGALVVAGTAGVAFGVVYGITLGPLFAVAATVALTATVSLTVSAWGAFTAARVWLALSGVFPLRIMSFLNEAHVRGVLRQAGGSYQFRHIVLKEALLTPSVHPGREQARADAVIRPTGEHTVP